MVCPDCNGKGETAGIVCPPGELRYIKCSMCSGTGQLSHVQEKWISDGIALRNDRVKRGLSLREEAQRLGITEYHLSQREHGRIESRPTMRAPD